MGLYSCATCWQPLSVSASGTVTHYDDAFGEPSDHAPALPPGVLASDVVDPAAQARSSSDVSGDYARISRKLAAIRRSVDSAPSQATAPARRSAVDKDGQNVRVTVDAGDVRFEFTDDEVCDYDIAAVFATLGEAKAWALQQAIAERDSWAKCVREIRNATTHDIL